MATHKSSPYLFTGVKRVVRQIGTLQASDYQALTLAQFNSYARGGGGAREASVPEVPDRLNADSWGRNRMVLPGIVAFLVSLFLIPSTLAQTPAPAVTQVAITSSPASGDTYQAGEQIVVRIDFNLVNVVVTGAPRLVLTIGTGTGQASYAGAGTTWLQFRYTVRATDADADGISIGANALSLNGGMIRSQAGPSVALGLGSHAITNDANHKVDGPATVPAVNAVAIVSSPGNLAGAYGEGDRITVEVGFQIAVTVTGMPQLALTIGSGSVQASYVSGSGTRSLTFRYTVQATDADSDGLSIGASALTLNSGTIQSAAMTNAALGLGTRAVSNAASHKVDGSIAVPTVSLVTLSYPARGDTFGAGETIHIQVTFQLRVRVTGTPQVALTIGSGTGAAGYTSGSGTTALNFRYTVRATDVDTDGISIGAGALSLNGGTIRSLAGRNAQLGLGAYAFTDLANRKVDGPGTRAPVVTGVSILSSPASGDTYGAGERIEVVVRFSMEVEVTGSPRLALTIGSATAQAGYTSGSGTTSLRFRHTVGAMDADSDGLSIGASALALNGGTIRSAVGTNAALGLGARALTDQAGHKVDGTSATVPAVVEVSIRTRPASGDTYGAGERIEVVVRFSIEVEVTGGPQLALMIGSATAQAQYVAGSGRKSLSFRYTVVAGDADSDGLSIGASALALNGGTILSVAGASAALGLGTHAVPTLTSHKVDGASATGPAVADVSIRTRPASGDTYGAGERIEVDVQFAIEVVVTGSPWLALTIGSATAQADYLSGSGGKSLSFRYTVRATDADTDGLSIGASALALNGGTIQSLAGTNAALGLGAHALAHQANHRVNGARVEVPEVTGISILSRPASGDTYGAGERIEVEVQFAIEVVVTGSPQLALTIGSATAQAVYLFRSGRRRSLRFRHTVGATDADSDGLSVGASALALNGGSIRSVAGTNAALGLGTHALTNRANHKVNGTSATVPAVTGVSIRTRPASGDTYGAGERIEVVVQFTIEVEVTGNPRLALTIGSAMAQAEYLLGSGGKSLWFGYTVRATDADSDGLSVGTSALTLNGGTIRSVAGANAALSLSAYQANQKVDGARATVPAVRGVWILGRPASGDTYGAGERIIVVVRFTIEVEVTGSPRLALTIGSATVQAEHLFGSGAKSQWFGYTVRATDLDSDGLSVGESALTLNGGTIQSVVGTNAALSLRGRGLTVQANHKIDGGYRAPVEDEDRLPVFPEETRVSDQRYHAESPIAALELPAALAGDGELTYTLTPGLPAGLRFDADTRVVAGTPLAEKAETRYRYMVLDEDGDRDSLYFTIYVAPDLKPRLAATVATQLYRNGEEIEPLVLPAAEGGDAPLTYSLVPDLPAGLAFYPAARMVAGTPTVTLASTWYALTVVDSDGDRAELRFALGVGGASRPSFGEAHVAPQR